MDNELDMVGHQDRAALIAMAGDLTLTRAVLQETQRTSWQYIWVEEIQRRLAYVSNTRNNIASSQKTTIDPENLACTDKSASEKEQKSVQRFHSKTRTLVELQN